MTTIEAIKHSISHSEIIRVSTPDKDRAFMDLLKTDGIEELDFSTENNGDLDVWGEYNGKEFRIRLAA